MESLMNRTCTWKRRSGSSSGDYGELQYTFSEIEADVNCRTEILTSKDIEENGLSGEEGITFYWLFLVGDHDIKIGDTVTTSDEIVEKHVVRVGDADDANNLHHQEVIIKRQETL